MAKEKHINDSDASAFIQQKDVILCRSGIQLYHKSELEGFITDANKPAIEREWYREYRPANVVVKAQEKCHSLPVTKEHPFEWVTPQNWKDLAGGTTDNSISVVALDGESEGEIGLKSNLTFYTDELYNYYKENKEVSLGYTCRKHWVDNPDEVGYDIILDEIMEVNHLAITKRGRGGSSVAVIDSILGGMKPMRTGIFAFLKSKKQTDSAPETFGKTVLNAVKNSKGTKAEELEAEMKSVLDSCSELKDCEQKVILMNAVRDCFDHKEDTLANEAGVIETLDAMWIDIHGDSLKEIANAFAKLKAPEKQVEGAAADSEEKKEDACSKDSEEKTDEEKTEDSEEKTDEKAEDSEEKTDEEKAEDSEEKKEDACSKDSALLDKDAIVEAVKDSLKPMIKEAVQELLGMTKDSKPSIEGSEIDSAYQEDKVDLNLDYSSFLEA